MKSFLNKAARHNVWLLVMLIVVVAAGTLLCSTAEEGSLPSEPAGEAASTDIGITMSSLKPILNLKLPLDYYDDGRVKVYLMADEAMVPPDLASGGRVEAKRVRVEIYAETGTNVDTVITAEDCVYDKKDGKATSKAAVRLERADVTMSGTGFEWTAKDQVVRILSNVKVTMSSNLNLGGNQK